MKSRVFAGAGLMLAGFALASCGQGSSQPAAEPSESALEAAPEAPAGIAVTNARLTLPAVKGNPGAVYFDIANNGAADAAIVGAWVEGSDHAMLHATSSESGTMSMSEMSTVPVPKGGTVSFAPGGNHVMAMGLADTFKAGDSADVTLTFANGDKVSFAADVRAPGDAD